MKAVAAVVVLVVLGMWVVSIVPFVRLYLADGPLSAADLPVRILLAVLVGWAIVMLWRWSRPWSRIKVVALSFVVAIYVLGLLMFDFDDQLASSLTAPKVDVVPMIVLRLLGLGVAASVVWK
jgi:hypothetical protein